jgi:hypothetical protein
VVAQRDRSVARHPSNSLPAGEKSTTEKGRSHRPLGPIAAAFCGQAGIAAVDDQMSLV